MKTTKYWSFFVTQVIQLRHLRRLRRLRRLRQVNLTELHFTQYTAKVLAMIFHCNKLDENERKQISMMMMLLYPFTLNSPHTTYIRFQNNDEAMLVGTKEGAHRFGQFPIHGEL